MNLKLNKILKGRPPYPFETIATAIAFSPTSEKVLAESVIMARAFAAMLIVIHIGQFSDEKSKKMSDLLAKFDLHDIEYKVVWDEGEPVNTILKICKNEVVDLLIAGALKKEKLFTFYKGSIARKLCRQAKCSLLILTNPKMNGTEFNKVIVNGVEHDKTIHTIKTSLYFSKYLKLKSVEVIEEIDPSMVKTTVEDEESCLAAQKEKRKIVEEEKGKMEEFLKEENVHHINVGYKCLFGKLGYTIGHYSEMKGADLLMMNSPSEKLGFLDRVFTHDLEYLLAELPTNLLIVHSRVNN